MPAPKDTVNLALAQATLPQKTPEQEAAWGPHLGPDVAPPLQTGPGFVNPIGQYFSNLVSGREPIEFKEPLDVISNWNETIKSLEGVVINQLPNLFPGLYASPERQAEAQKVAEAYRTQGSLAAQEASGIPDWAKLLGQIGLDPTTYLGWGLLGKIPIAGKVLGPVEEAVFAELPAKIMGGAFNAVKATPIVGKLFEPSVAKAATDAAIKSKPSSLYNDTLKGIKELWLATPSYHIYNALDQFSKSIMHGFWPWASVDRTNALFNKLGLEVPEEIAKSFNINELGPQVSSSVFRQGILQNAGLRATIGATGGAVAGYVGGEGDPKSIVLGALSGAVGGAVLPNVLELNRRIATTLESSARSAAAEYGLKKTISEKLPSFLDEAAKVVPDPTALNAASTANRGLLAARDVVQAAKAGGAADNVATGLGQTWQNILDQARAEGVGAVSHIHFNYNDTYRIDDFLRQIVPFHIWATRNIPYYMQHVMEHPGLFDALFAYNDLSQQQIEEQNLTQRFQGKITPEEQGQGDMLAEVIFGTPSQLFFNPTTLLSIAGQLREPYVQDDQSTAEKILAYTQLTGLNVWPWWGWMISALTDGSNTAGDLFPQSKIIRSASEVAGVPIEPEPWRGPINRAITGEETLTGSPVEDYYIRKTIAELSYQETGKPNDINYLKAMWNPDDPIYQRAKDIVYRMYLGQSASRWLLPLQWQQLPLIEAQVRAEKQAVKDELYGTENLPADVKKQLTSEAYKRHPLANLYQNVFSTKEELDQTIAKLSGSKTKSTTSSATKATQTTNTSNKYSEPYLSNADFAAYLEWKKTNPGGTKSEFLQATGRTSQ